GDNIQTTWAGGTYVQVTGTSPATAIVSGIAALGLSARHLDTAARQDTALLPSACHPDTARLKAPILRSVDAVPALAGMTVTGGRVNAATAVRQCAGGHQAPLGAGSRPGEQTHIT